MNIRRRFIEMLVRLYPPAWRREYGSELVELLATHSLSSRVVVDVLWSASRERIRSSEPAMWLGLPALFAALGVLIANVVAPQPYGGWTTILEPSAMTFPSVRVRAVISDVFCVLLFCCGWWTYRRGSALSQTGWAAARLCLVAGVPIIVVGALLQLGLIDLSVVRPGVAAAGIQRGLAFSYYSADDRSLSPVMVMLFPLSRLPIAWLWGSLGGYAARATARPDTPTRVAP
jgi:hypothetical protein